MNKIIINLCLYFFVISICNAQLSTEDQKKHFAAGLIISSVTYNVVYSKTKNKTKAFFYSLGMSTLAGLSKEFYDSQKFNTKLDTGEVFATSIGGLTASVTLSVFVGRKNRKRKNIALTD